MALINVNWSPRTKQLRSFGLVAVLVFTAISFSVARRSVFLGITLTHDMAVIFANAFRVGALGCGLLGLFRPNWLKPLFLGLSVATYPIGFVMSYLVMGIVYYLVLTPIGVGMRLLLGRDPLSKNWEPTSATYWTQCAPETDGKRYLRQY